VESPTRMVGDPRVDKRTHAGNCFKAQDKAPSEEGERSEIGQPGGPDAPSECALWRRRRAPSERGHGRRLTMAFEALEHFRALAESRRSPADGDRQGSRRNRRCGDRRRVRRRAHHRRPAHGPIRRRVGRVESTPPSPPSICSRRRTVQTLAARVRTFDFFERSASWEAAPGALPLARSRNPARRRPRRGRGRLRAPGPSDRHKPPPRHRQARAAVCLSGLSVPGASRREKPRRTASIASAASSASTTPSWAAFSRGAWGPAGDDRNDDRAPPQPRGRGRAAFIRPGRHACPLRAGCDRLAERSAPERPQQSGLGRGSSGG